MLLPSLVTPPLRLQTRIPAIRSCLAGLSVTCGQSAAPEGKKTKLQPLPSVQLGVASVDPLGCRGTSLTRCEVGHPHLGWRGQAGLRSPWWKSVSVNIQPKEFPDSLAVGASKTLRSEISNHPHPTPTHAVPNMKNSAIQSLHLFGPHAFLTLSSFYPQVQSSETLLRGK